MDFSDSPEEAAFRAKARDWLDANATRRDGSEKTQDHFMARDADEVARACDVERHVRRDELHPLAERHLRDSDAVDIPNRAVLGEGLTVVEEPRGAQHFVRERRAIPGIPDRRPLEAVVGEHARLCGEDRTEERAEPGRGDNCTSACCCSSGHGH